MKTLLACYRTVLLHALEGRCAGFAASFITDEEIESGDAAALRAVAGRMVDAWIEDSKRETTPQDIRALGARLVVLVRDAADQREEM